MTIKKIFSKAKTRSQNNKKIYEVKLNFDIAEQRSITELVKANSDEEALEKAQIQFSHRSIDHLFHCADRNWWENRFNIQNISQQIINKNKKIYLSHPQQEILEKLCKGYHLKINTYYDSCKWVIVKTSENDDWGNAVNITTINALFRKGLLIPIAVRDMSTEELNAQIALGSIGDMLTTYGVNYDQVKQLGIKLKNMPQS